MRDAFDRFTADPPKEELSATSPTDGFCGVFHELVFEHRQIVALIERVSKQEPHRLLEAWPELSEMLINHERAERLHVYPALHAFPSMSNQLQEHSKEVGALETMISQMGPLSLAADDWALSFSRLAELFKQHVQEEEVQVFPRAQDLLGKDRCEQLSRERSTRKQE